MEFQEFITKQKEVINLAYDQAKSYSNIIIFGGYAGIFATWNLTKDQLQSWQVATVGASIMLSLLFFVSFELVALWIRASQTRRLMRQLEESEKQGEFVERYGVLEQKRGTTLLKLWPAFFFPAVLFALTASLVLLYSFIAMLATTYNNVVCLSYEVSQTKLTTRAPQFVSAIKSDHQSSLDYLDPNQRYLAAESLGILGQLNID